MNASLSLSAEGEDPAEGARVTYKIELANNDTLPMAKICVWDTLPPGVVFAQNYSMVEPVITGQYVFWELPEDFVLNPGKSITLEYTVILTDLMDGEVITSRAGADYNDPYNGGIPDGTGWVAGKHEPIYSNVAYYPGGLPVVFPNPFSPAGAINGRLKFDNLVPGSMIYIYTISGEMVITFKSGNIREEWDGKNWHGTKCSPGVYYYMIRNRGSSHVHKGKIFMVR